MNLLSLGYVGISTSSATDWRDYGTGLLGLQLVDRSARTLAFRMDDRSQRIHIEEDGGDGCRFFGWEVADAAALDGFGLLTRKTILAHSNFLTDADMDRLVAQGSGVAHCALSNIYFANSVFPLRHALEKGVHVGLGTDISGGPSASMFSACLTSVQSSRLLEDGVDPARPAPERGRANSAIDLVTAFHLATAGGGVALDLPIGVLAPGYHFDAMAVDTSAEDGAIRLFGGESPGDIFQKIIYGATRANIANVWIDGVPVRVRPTAAATVEPLPAT